VARIDAEWLAAPATRRVLAALEAARPGGARFVGGCVRNALMGKAVDDIDIATQLLPEQVVAAAASAGLAAHPTGIAHGTITLVADHQPFEVTTLRRDVTADGRHATVAFTEDWAEDASRRDFRLNALYADPDGQLHDPTGGGLEDAAAGRIIFIGDAETRLREDYLRILRFFRFSAWYGRGSLEARGLAACAALREGLATLSVERVWKELKKLLAAPDPRLALAAMTQTGVQARAWPEAALLDRLHALVALDLRRGSAAEPMVRAAAAMADASAAKAFARRLKLANDERDRLVAALDGRVSVRPDMSGHEVRAALYRLGQVAFHDRALLAWAEAPADVGFPELLQRSADWVRTSLPVGGDDAIALGAAGPAVGELLRAIEAWWIDADFPPDRAAALAQLKVLRLQSGD
jgi:poly(A) polymerase